MLEHLDSERDWRGDARFGKTAEERIIWGELIELELQALDEQVSRIVARLASVVACGMGTDKMKEASHERDG